MTVESIDFSRFKYCECKPDCPELISIKDKWGRLRRFKRGHNMRGKIGENHPCWRGGRIMVNGYWVVWKPDHPYCDNHGYVLEHRLVMEQHLGRYLTQIEEVHHINKIRTDNRIDNLMLFATKADHRRYELIKNMDDRLCILCDSKETEIRNNGRPHWYGDGKNGYICMRCYKKNKKQITKRKILFLPTPI